jgi:penicillin-binding protein 2
LDRINKHQVIFTLIWLAAGVLILKSAQLQIFDKSFADKARRVTLDKEEVYPSRGLISDRYGDLLVVNKPVYELKATFNQIDPKMDTSFFCELLDIDKQVFIKNLAKNWSSPRYHKSIPFIFLTKIKPEVFAAFQEHIHLFPGFQPVYRKTRTYRKANAAHALGYLGEVSENDLKAEPEEYNLGDYIGKRGIEKNFEKLLKGEKGVKYLIKDNLGRPVSDFENGRLDSSAVAGKDLQLSLDMELQAFGEKLMQNKRGSIVAIEPKTGEILSILSAPSYNPSVFELNEERGEKYKELAADSINKPFLDRSINAKYPPGSIFKPILSLIAFQEGASYPDRTIYCNGYYQYRGFKYGCHNHTTPYNVQIALLHSCNSYYFQMVRDLIEIEGFSKPEKGLNILVNHLKDFGLGVKLGVDLPNESTGFLPTPEFYDRLYKNELSGWKSTYIMSIGIGQGELELTTLQMANLAAILANRGYYYTPHVVKSISGSNLSDHFLIKKQVRIDSIHFPPVIEGMERTVKVGTGNQAFVYGLDICGKTGTSQNPHGEDHSVFFAFAPKDDPQIAIAVYVENAGFGGDVAAPIAGLMIEKYLKKVIAPNRKYIENRITNLKLINRDVVSK